MKIKNVKIKNFKSICELDIPFEKYGIDGKSSNSTFFVGINESGKSSVLEALSLIKEGLHNINYADYCYKPAYDNNEYIDIYVDLEIENHKFWSEHFVKTCLLPEKLSINIKIKKIEKNLYLKDETAESQINIEIEDLQLFEYIKNSSDEVGFLKDLNNIDETITSSNAHTFYQPNQIELTKDDLEGLLSEKLGEIIENSIPKITIWKPEPEYLISTKINLNEFKENTNISILLKNIFHIYGKTKDSDIKETIERALSTQEKCDELKDKMTSTVTKHLNKIWKEHKIKIVISINSENCQIFVEDKDKKHAYYKLNQRSDGFKQFVSLMLSLSALNDSNQLKNNIILIDEPEVHLHPSGVRYMRDELLKIGKNNQLFISTHSHYMVDTSCPERHWIVTKESSETKIKQINENTPIEDDAVLASAFGLNLFKELLPKNIIVVEGGDDKEVILHALNKLKSNFFYSIKSAGGASKAPGIASLLSNEKIPAFFLFDDDKEGKDNMRKIIDNQKDSFSEQNVFTIKNILNSLPKDSTLEDLLPISYVTSFFNKEMEDSFTLNEETAIIFQLKQQNENLKNNKSKMDSLKLKLSKNFTNDFNTKSKIERDAPKLTNFINAFTSKIESIT